MKRYVWGPSLISKAINHARSQVETWVRETSELLVFPVKQVAGSYESPRGCEISATAVLRTCIGPLLEARRTVRSDNRPTPRLNTLGPTLLGKLSR